MSARGGEGGDAPGCRREQRGGAGRPAPCWGPSPRGSPAGGTWRTGRSRPPCLRDAESSYNYDHIIDGFWTLLPTGKFSACLMKSAHDHPWRSIIDVSLRMRCKAFAKWVGLYCEDPYIFYYYVFSCRFSAK